MCCMSLRQTLEILCGSLQIVLAFISFFAFVATSLAECQNLHILPCNSIAMAPCQYMLAAFCCLFIFCLIFGFPRFDISNLIDRQQFRHVKCCRRIGNRRYRTCRKRKTKIRFRKLTFWLMMMILLMSFHHSTRGGSRASGQANCRIHVSLCFGYLSKYVTSSYRWCLSRKQRNKKMHAANGNGGKSGSKGYSSKSWPPVANEDPEITFQRSIIESMPQAARLRLQAQLIPEEWSAATVLSSELNHKGGIALCYKADLPSVLQRVGFTMEPTAVLLSQDPSSLGMRGYTSEIISCNIRVLKDDGTPQLVQVERFLTQLGFAEHVVQVACGTLVHLPTCMHKCVAKFPAMYGWTADMVTGSTISQILQKHLPQGSFTEIQPRLHDKTLSATFRVHSDLIDTTLKLSGQDRIFYKLHDSESVRPSLELLWLPEQTNIEDALTLSATSKDEKCISKLSIGTSLFGHR